MKKFTKALALLLAVTMATSVVAVAEEGYSASDATYASEFLGGQNHVALFTENAKNIDMSNISPYDQGLNETFQAAFKDYFDGNVDYDTALANFYNNAIVKYPNLVKPATVPADPFAA